MTTNQLIHYNICVTPTFTKDGMKYKFEVLKDDDTRILFRFIVLILYKYFGINLHFVMRKNKVIISMLSLDQMKILQEIAEDTGGYIPIKYGLAILKFEIEAYNIF